MEKIVLKVSGNFNAYCSLVGYNVVSRCCNAFPYYPLIGPIGKLCEEAEKVPINDAFQPITSGNDLRLIPEEVIDNFSTDQHYLYQMVRGIQQGTTKGCRYHNEYSLWL